MICSSENLLRFISSVLRWAGLYFKLEEFSQGRSGEDTAARGDVRAMHLAAWHQAASGWYCESAANMATTGSIPQSAFTPRLPGGTPGSAITFTATGLHASADGTGTVVSWIDSADITERRVTSAAVVKYSGLSMSAGSFEAATGTIMNPQLDSAERVAVPAALAAQIPDGAPVVMTSFE